MPEISEPVRVGVGIKTWVCLAPKPDSFHFAIQAFKDHGLKATFGPSFASDELCDCGHKALMSYMWKKD